MHYFKIERPVDNYQDRNFSASLRVAGLLGIMIMCGLCGRLINDRRIQSMTSWMYFSLFITGIFLIIEFRKAYIYLHKIELFEDKMMLAYRVGKKELTLDDNLENIEIKLKNTASRRGFSCEIVLKIKNKKFVIDYSDHSNWSKKDVYDLFEKTKKLKGEQLSSGDKFNMAKLLEKHLKG